MDPRNLLGLMKISGLQLLIVPVLLWCAPARSQSGAAVQQILAHHPVEDVNEMQELTHYKYMAELFYYSASFLIEENGAVRAATEEEIAAIDLHVYDGVRLEAMRTGVHDPVLNEHVILLPKNECEQLLLGRLSHADRDAFMAWKATLQSGSQKTHP